MDKEELWFGIKILLSIAVGVIVLLGICLAIAIPLNKTSCLKAYSEYQPRYSFWSGCQIVWDGKLTPVDMVKNISVEK